LGDLKTTPLMGKAIRRANTIHLLDNMLMDIRSREYSLGKPTTFSILTMDHLTLTDFFMEMVAVL